MRYWPSSHVPLVGREIPIPGAHLAGRQRQAAALLALQEPRVRGLELRRALGDMALELQVQLLELAGLAVKLDEDFDLGAQHIRDDRYRHVVHRAHGIAAQPVDVSQVDRGNEDDRRLAETRMLAQHGGELKAVELRHADVDENDRDVVLEQELQGLARRRGLDQVLVQFMENHLVGEQLVGLIVDQEDVDFLGHDSRP